MKKGVKLAVVSCKRCGRAVTTALPVVSELQCICRICCTLEEEYDILEAQANGKKGGTV